MNPLLLRDLHLEALQRTFALPDTTVGAIELVLDIALNQQHCEEMTDLVKLKDYLMEKKPYLRAPFSPAAGALCYILQLEALNAKLAEECSEANLKVAELRILLPEPYGTLPRKTITQPKEPGTEAATNPPEPTPMPDPATTLLPSADLDPAPSVMMSVITPIVQKIRHSPIGSSNGHNGNSGNSGKTKPKVADEDQSQPLAYDWSKLLPEVQGLITELEQKKITWKSLTTTQKTALAVEVASQILAQEPDFPSTTLSHELFNRRKPQWMATLQGLAVGVTLPISGPRALAVEVIESRAQSQANKPSDETRSPSSDDASSEPKPGSN